MNANNLLIRIYNIRYFIGFVGDNAQFIGQTCLSSQRLKQAFWRLVNLSLVFLLPVINVSLTTPQLGVVGLAYIKVM